MANKHKLRVSGSDSYALLILFKKFGKFRLIFGLAEFIPKDRNSADLWLNDKKLRLKWLILLVSVSVATKDTVFGGKQFYFLNV